MATVVATASYYIAKLDLCFAKDVVLDSVDIAGNAGFDYGAEVLLILLDVVGEGTQQSLGMNGIHDDARTYLCIGCAGQHLGKVQHYLGWTMGNNSKVAIGTLCHIGNHVDFEVFHRTIIVIVCHSYRSLFVSGFHFVDVAHDKVLVFTKTRTSRDEMTDNDVLLHTLEEVALGVDGSLGEHLGGLLE